MSNNISNYADMCSFKVYYLIYLKALKKFSPPVGVIIIHVIKPSENLLNSGMILLNVYSEFFRNCFSIRTLLYHMLSIHILYYSMYVSIPAVYLFFPSLRGKILNLPLISYVYFT